MGDRDGGEIHPNFSRRQVLQLSGMGGVGLFSVGGGTVQATADHRLSADSELPETATWMTDDVPEKPLHDICLPGTHHAAMDGCGANFWWHCQSNDMVQQLEDGVRYFDIRVGAYYEKETLVQEGIAQQMSDEWVALFDEAGGPGSLVPDIPGVDGDFEDELNALLGLLLDEDDPEWVAEKYTESCLDAGSTPEGRELPLDALLLRVLAAVFAFDGFDVPDFGLDLSTIRLDESADTEVQPDGFKAHHGGQEARPYDWGASLESTFVAMTDHFDSLDAVGASELAIVDLKHFWDLLNVTFDQARADAFTTMVEDAFGEYLLVMSQYSVESFAALTPTDLDGPKVAIIISGLPGDDPDWVGSSSYISGNWPNETEPGAVFRHGVTHTETTSHSPTELDRVGFQVTPDENIVLQVSVEDILGSYDSRIQYTNLLEAAERTNLLLGAYAEEVKRNPEQNPNIISLDYYETSPLVSVCRELSREDFINGDSQSDSLPVPEADYRLVSVGEGCPLGKDMDGCVEPDNAGVFSLVANDDGSYRVETPDGVLTADGTENGAALTHESWDGSQNQRWFVVPLSDATGQCVLINHASGLTLDFAQEYNDSDDGTVSTWHLHAGGNQRWWVIPADGPPPVVAGAFPRDDDGDGLYEVVTGGEAFSIADVQTLFANLDGDAVQDHHEAYDFSGLDTDRVSVFDVQALFNRLE